MRTRRAHAGVDSRGRQRCHAGRPPGLSGTASGVFNASRQVGTSIGLAILGAVGADAATSAWANHIAHLPGSAWQAAIGQARDVASARIGSVTRALGAGQKAPAEHAFFLGYTVAVLIAGFCLIAAAILAVFGLRDDRRPQPDAAAGKNASPGEPRGRRIAAKPLSEAPDRSIGVQDRL